MISTFLFYKIILVVLVFAISLGVAAYATYGERKVAAFMQDRVGPDRAGPFGLLQPIADGVKMFMKEDFIPANSNKFLFILGPSIAMTTALMTAVVVPWASPVSISGELVPVQITDINIGLLYVFGVVSIGVYGIMIGGWASNNKYSMLGALRASSQMISYEIAMGLSIISIVMLSGSMSLGRIVEQQSHGGWFVFLQPLSFLIFLICAFAETNRAPFDLPECETELVGGYHTEYSSMKLGFFLFAEYVNMFNSGAIIASLFFGGYNLPFADFFTTHLGANTWLLSLIQFSFFFGKILFFIFFFMWIRWTLPRFRYDQLMTLGWKILLPLSIVNIMVTGLVMYFTGQIQ
jgi:NADH-quinone oxidoreductase subunit H